MMNIIYRRKANAQETHSWPNHLKPIICGCPFSFLWLKDHGKTAEIAAALQAQTAAIGDETIYSSNQVRQIFDGTMDFGRTCRPDIIIQPLPVSCMRRCRRPP